jgi:hypothetical protein
MAKDPILEQTVPTKELAEQLSEILGCSGAHRVSEDAWGPCESSRDLQKLIELGNPAFREWKKKQRGKKVVEEFFNLKAVKDKAMFSTRAEAEMAAVRLGCVGAHQPRQGVWAPCGTPEEHNAAHGNSGGRRNSRIIRAARPARRVVTDSQTWENLRERGPRGIETLPGGGLVSAKAAASDSFKPTSGMVDEAERALKWRKEFGRGGTMVGIARARDIKNGRDLPYRTVKRMKAFFDRHQSDSKAEGYRPGEKGFPSNGRIAWALWGGDAGYTWSKDIVARVEGTSKSFDSIEEKRVYTDRRRDEYAKRGWALPDGSYPIRDVGDLRNAIQAFGLGKDPDAAKRHILKRARALGRLDIIPESWKKREKSAKAYGPNDPKTPAKPSERVRGSDKNKPGSAASTRGGIALSDAVENALKGKVTEHNERMVKRGKEERKVTLGMLKAVWRRGAGAFSQTHRPKMNRQQWAMGRVNAFLKLTSSGKPANPKYTTDNDLLPKKHPRSTRK